VEAEVEKSEFFELELNFVCQLQGKLQAEADKVGKSRVVTWAEAL
jgi:hypothetical protein